MPGIVGLISRIPPEQAILRLKGMLLAFPQTPFYKKGLWADREAGVYVGWTVRDMSFAEGAPLRNETADVVLAFSGEEYSDPRTSELLRNRGHTFAPDGLDYLFHVYEEDKSFPSSLNGRFHGLVIDQRQGIATLFNDRYGMHRLYYFESEDAFYFAAEAKAILAIRPELRRVDYQSLGEFVSCGAVLEDRTLFKGIRVLPPGSAWVFRNGSLERRESYFHPKEWEDQESLDAEAYYRELREVFCRNLPRYFDSRQAIGMSLTGGLDTRIILANHRPEPGSLPCYTFGSMFRDNQDVRVARRVAEACGQSHQVITAGREFLSQFPRYAERTVYLTDGCVDVSRAPDLYLNERAREIAPVRMTGNYGGEILRGVVTFKPAKPTDGVYSADFLKYVCQAAETYAEIRREHPVTFAAFRQCPWHLYGILALEQTQLTMRSPYLDNDFVRTVFRSPAFALTSNEVSMRLVTDGDKTLMKIPTDRGLAGTEGRIWRAVQRSFLEFLFKAEYAYDMGMPQWMARTDHAVSLFRLERLFLGWHKPFHFRVWYRDALAAYIQEILLDERALSRPHIDRKGLITAVRGHIKGNRNYTNEIHKLLTLELLHRLFLDSEAPRTKQEELLCQAACAK
jgi:asparagine synthase (glutamine-hydrolysing)